MFPKKVMHIVAGGKERYHSTLAAVEAYKDEPDCNMLIHDAARPLVTTDIITKTNILMEPADCRGRWFLYAF